MGAGWGWGSPASRTHFCSIDLPAPQNALPIPLRCCQPQDQEGMEGSGFACKSLTGQKVRSGGPHPALPGTYCPRGSSALHSVCGPSLSPRRSGAAVGGSSGSQLRC